VRSHRNKQTNSIVFMQVKIPKKTVARQTDIEASDHIQNMQQNIQVMNQVYKNLYAIYEDWIVYNYLGNNYISLEVLIEKEIIKFFIWAPKQFSENISKTISSFYPGTVIDIVSQPKLLESGKYMAGWEFSLKKQNSYPIKTYETFEVDPMDSILSAYSKVSINEKLCLQMLISPLNEKQTRKLREKAEKIKQWDDIPFIVKLWKRLRRNAFTKTDKIKDEENADVKHHFSQQQLWDIDKKTDEELFNVKIKAFASSPERERPKQMLTDLAGSLSQYYYSGLNYFKFSATISPQVFAKEFVQRVFFTDKWIINNFFNFKKKSILNTKELSSIMHFPHSRFNFSPRLSWQTYKIVPAPENLPTEWMLLWYNEYAGVKKEIYLKPMDRFRHVYVIWQTGTWKTTLLVLQAIRDLQLGNWFCYIDPHGDACEDILTYFPKERIDDLIYFDLSNTEYPIGFNPLQAETEDERDIITNDLVEMFVNMYWHEIFGPRIQDYFRNACFLLMEQPEWWTLVDIMRLFTDDAFAEAKIRNVKNPIISAWWNKTYKKMWEREKSEAIPFMQAKFGPFTTWVYVRNIIGQPKPAFNLFDAMQEKKIILCNLSKWLAWEVNSQLIWRMLAMQIKIAALKRAGIAQEDRVPFFLYIDEFQNYVSKSIESVLSEARKYRLGLTVAHQYIEQLKSSGLWWSIDLSTAIFGNVWTIFAMKVGAPDAEFLEKEFTPEFGQSDLINMDKFKWVMKMSVDSQQSRPFSFAPLYFGNFEKLCSKEKIAIIKQISALKRWTKRELVDKEIYFRVGV